MIAQNKMSLLSYAPFHNPIGFDRLFRKKCIRIPLFKG